MKPQHTQQKNPTGLTAFTAQRAVTGLAHRASVILAIIAAIFIFGSGKAFAQARITSPQQGSILAYPSFQLAWPNVGGIQYWLQLGSRQGAADYFSGSVGTTTSVGLNWTGNRPAACWIRLWTASYSGYANSTPATAWTFTDACYQLAPQGQAIPAKSALIEDFLNGAISAVNDFQRSGIRPTGTTGKPIQCKEFLQQKFDKAGYAYKLSNGYSPVMPANAVTSEGSGIHNWFWSADWASGFNQIGAVNQGSNVTDKRTALTALLRQARRGDVLQFVMKARQEYPSQEVASYVPHTIAFLEAYQSDNTALNWVDANMDGIGTPTMGTQWPFGGSKTINSLADRIGTIYGAATLYRVRDDMARRQ